MAVETYLRNAADALMRAAGELRTEIDQIRSSDINGRALIATQMAQISSQIQLAQHDSSKVDTSDTVRNANALNSLKNQLAAKQREMDDKHKQAEDSIKEKTAQIADLETKARSLMG